MIRAWEVHAEAYPHTAEIIEKGLDKLREYQGKTYSSSAYTIATGA